MFVLFSLQRVEAMLSNDLIKTREICFYTLPVNQHAQAWLLLVGMDGLDVQKRDERHSIQVTYSLADYSLENLENALLSQGFHLDNSLFQKIHRALIYYCERVQMENLRAPEHLLKSRKIFVEIYQHHPHGDHDDTPVEWREYR
jgi:hypothetical protein